MHCYESWYIQVLPKSAAASHHNLTTLVLETIAITSTPFFVYRYRIELDAINSITVVRYPSRLYLTLRSNSLVL